MTPRPRARVRAGLRARHWRHLALACVLGAAGCAAQGPASGPCAVAGADTAGWRDVDVGPFRLSLPAEYEQEEVQGIDSVVRRWVASRKRSVNADFGMYSNSLNDAAETMEGGRECMARIHGRTVKLVSGYDARGEGWGVAAPKYVVAAAWRHADGESILTMYATTGDSAGVPVLLSIMRSVRLHPSVPR